MSAEQKVFDSIRRIVRALRLSSKATEADLGLSSAQLFVLQKLDGGAELSINEIAARTLTHQSSVSAVIAKLLDKGLVERRPAPDDVRRAAVSLTSKGKNLLRSAPDPAQLRLLRALRGMTKRDLDSLALMLDELVEAAGFTSESPELFFEG